MVAIAESSRCHRRARTCLRAGSALCKRRQKPETRFHRNQQYSITALTDASGSIVERYAYIAYGQPTLLDASGTSLTSTKEIAGSQPLRRGLFPSVIKAGFRAHATADGGCEGIFSVENLAVAVGRYLGANNKLGDEP